MPDVSRSKRRFNVKNILAGIGAAAIVTVLVWVVLTHFAMKLLFVNRPLKQADWIVLLGGESGERVIGAAELYHLGIAPKIFVTGAGDCVMNATRLAMAGVPAANISYECESRSTYQNAIFTRDALSTMQPQKVVLVTSWFHTRRALWTFQHLWPDVQFGTLGVVPGGTSYLWLPLHESGWITLEYIKYAWYRTACAVASC